MPVSSRRTFLATLGGTSIIGLAGCTDRQPRYRLSTRSLGPSLTRTFSWEPYEPFKAFNRDLATEIVTEGTVKTDGYRLSNTGPDNPSYVEQDGSYYEIRVTEADTVTREKWSFWFDRVDSEPPATAEVFSSSLGLGDQTPLAATYGLSDLDVHAVETAAGKMAPEYGFIDLEGEPPAHRGYLFLRRSLDETDLLPDPPFTHVVFESGDGKVYARAVAERVSVELTQFRHTAITIGTSQQEFSQHLRETYLETTLSSETLSNEQRSLLSTAQRGQGYEETVPLSDGFTEILERLGVADTQRPEPRYVEISDDVYFEYDDAYYEAQLEIFG